MGTGVIVPWQGLSPEALQGLVEEFVTRDGTDSGYARKSLAADVRRVKRQLEQGKAVIVYDEELRTCNIVSRRDLDEGDGDEKPGNTAAGRAAAENT